MKKIFLFFVLNFWIGTYMQGQVMHSSNAMEYSIGGESFLQFVAQSAGLQVGGGSMLSSQEVRRWRPILSGRYKKFQDSGDYFGFGLHLAHSSWREEVLIEDFVDFFSPTGDPMPFLSLERNQETKIGGSYQYSLLIGKEKDSNFQFLVGGIADFYVSNASKRSNSVFFLPSLRRNVVGVRVSAMPELMYLVPNSRITISLRGILPIMDLQRVDEDIRQSSLNSFVQFSTRRNSFQLVPIDKSRFEIGFGYFLKSE